MATKKLLVVGGSGYLGGAIASLPQSRGNMIATYQRNRLREDFIRYGFPTDCLVDLVRDHAVETIIFAAEIEKNQTANSVVSPNELQAAFRETLEPLGSLRFIYVSSDGIFCGKKGCYVESDAPDPITAYGRNLLVCEEVVRTVCDNWCIVRPSYLYGHSQGVLDSRLERTCEARDSSYFEDMYKSPIHVQDAARVITKLAFMDHVGVVHIGGPRMSVLDFHRQGAAWLRANVNITAERMPLGAGLLRDTSLDTSLSTNLTGFVPTSIQESFSRYPP